MPRDHRVGVRLDALLAAIADDARPDGPALAKVAARVHDVVHLECREQLRELKRLWAAYDPNPEGIPRPAVGPEGLAPCLRALDALLVKANYVPIESSELERALARSSVFPLALHTRLDDFAEYKLWRRGLSTRTEVLPGWFGLRRRTVRVESFERVVLALRFADASHFVTRMKRGTLPFTPGETTIKLFQDVPTDDLEMLFPNTTIKMRWRDHLAMWLPAIFGGIGVLAKSLGPLAVVAGLIWLRMREGGEPTLGAQEWAALGLAGSAAVAIVLFSIRQLSRFKARKIQFLQLLTRNLYFRNLDNNAGVFHRVLDSAEEEETAEAVLGYALLRWHGPSTIANLDGLAEGWLAERFGAKVDLETDDALAKLERLGLATEADGLWRALAPDEALAVLDQPQPRSNHTDSRGSQIVTSVRTTSTSV